DIKLKQVDLKVLVPYLDNVSLEEDETLQDLWANLMANYVDASKNLTTTVYPGVLSQLSSEEVRMLSVLSMGFGRISSLFPEWPIVNDQPMLNLIRLGLAEQISKDAWSTTDNGLPGIAPTRRISSNAKYALTQFGRAFL